MNKFKKLIHILRIALMQGAIVVTSFIGSITIAYVLTQITNKLPTIWQFPVFLGSLLFAATVIVSFIVGLLKDPE